MGAGHIGVGDVQTVDLDNELAQGTSPIHCEHGLHDSHRCHSGQVVRCPSSGTSYSCQMYPVLCPFSIASQPVAYMWLGFLRHTNHSLCYLAMPHCTCTCALACLTHRSHAHALLHLCVVVVVQAPALQQCHLTMSCQANTHYYHLPPHAPTHQISCWQAQCWQCSQ